MTATHYLLFWIVCAGLFLLPGALLASRSRLLWDRLGPGERVLPAFLLSGGIYGFTYLAAMAVRPTMGFALGLWAAIFAALLLWNLVERLRSRRARPAGLPPLDAPGGAIGWLWALPILLFGWIAMLIQGGSLGFTHDSLDFAAYVNRMLLTGRIDIASGAYEATAGLPPDPRRGAFHLAAALLCHLARLSATEMWRVFPTFLVPLALWIFFAAFRRLLRSAAVAFASLVFFVVATFFTGDHLINTLAYASRLGWVYSWIGLWSVALYLDRDQADHTPPGDWSALRHVPGGGRAAVALAVVCAPILIGIHILSAAQYLISLGAFAWVWALARQEPKPVRRVLFWLPLVSAAALAPFLVLKLRHSYSTANPLFDHPQGLLYVAGDWAVLGPGHLASWFGWPGLLGVLIGLWMLPRWRWDRGHAYLAGSTLIPLLIVLNPVAIRVIEGAKAHSLLFRVLFVVPYFQVLGWCSVKAVQRLRSPGSWWRRVAVPILFFIPAAFFLTLHYQQAVRSWRTPAIYKSGLRELPALRAALSELDREEPDPAVVVSDPITSYAIPAYTRHYAMTPFNQHSSPSDARTVERIQDSQAILSAVVPVRRTVELLRKYNARYVLLNESWPRYQAEYYTLISPVAFPRQRAKFLGRPGLFELLYDKDGILIFRFRDPVQGLTGDSLDLPDPYQALPAAEAKGSNRLDLARRFGAQPFPGPVAGGLELLATRPDSLVFHRGSPLVVSTWWRRTDEPMVLPVAAFLRLETAWPQRLFENPVLGRAWRVWYQSRHHVTFRFGRAFEPLASVFPAYLWPPGAVYKEGLLIYVPATAKPGVYKVRIRLSEVPFSPNLRLADLFTLHDSLDGPVVGTVRIE